MSKHSKRETKKSSYVYYSVIKNESSEAVLAMYCTPYNLVNVHTVAGVEHIDVRAANECICLNNTNSKLRKPARPPPELPEQPSNSTPKSNNVLPHSFLGS